MNPNPSIQKSLYSPTVSFEFNYKKNVENGTYENKIFRILRIEQRVANTISILAMYVDSNLNFIPDTEFDKFKRSSIRTSMKQVTLPEELLEKISDLFYVKAALKPEFKKLIVQDEVKTELAKFWH